MKKKSKSFPKKLSVFLLNLTLSAVFVTVAGVGASWLAAEVAALT